MNATKPCPSCRKPLAANAPDGLCAECLAKAALPTGMDPGPDSQPENGRTTFQAPPVEEVARLFPQLEILNLIGQGGMGAVYRARQKDLDRIVALKILPPDLGADPAFADRFAREARALAKLNHPGIVTLYEFGRTGGLFFFLMELVDGVNLRQLLSAGRISPREALAIVPQICDALQYAHDQGIVHRDIKPENILMDRQGRVKVADFGLAKLVGGGDCSAGCPDVELADASLLTEAGKVMGTPQYMAPEQVEHPREVDHRADIYSLGVVFYQMLTDELPGKQLDPPSRKVQVDVRLDEVVLRALEKEPERRYQQASQVKTDVEAVSGAGPSIPAPARPPEEVIYQAGSKPNRPFGRRMAVLALALSLLGWAAALLSSRVGPNGEIQSNVGWSLLYGFEIPALICGILARQVWLGRAAILLSGAFLLFPLLYPAWGASGLSRWTDKTAEDGVGPRQVVDVAKMPGGPWIGHWPGGGEVELLGLAPRPSHNQSWWRPDGSPIEGGGLFSWSRYVQKSGPHFLVQELVFRFANLPAGASLPEYYFEPNGIWLYGQAGYALGQEAQDLEMLAVSLPKSALPSSQVLRFRVGIALGAWSTVAEDHGQSSYTSISQEGYSWIINFANATELNGQTAVTVTHTVTNREVRVVAIDADRKAHVGQMVGTRRGGPSPTGPIRSDPFTQLTATFPDLPLAQARDFRLQVRPYEWVEFRNVAWQPRERREPSPAAAPIAVPPEFRTNLPSGTVVELVGLSHHPSIGHRWWRPNGQALDAVPYLNQTRVFRNATNRDAYELAYRIHRPPNASHWQGNLQVSGNVGLGSFVPQDSSGQPFSDVQAEAILFKSGQTTTEVRIGVALGRWDFVGVTNQEISLTQEGRWIRISKPRENAGRSILELERDLSWDNLATEIVAVDHQGQVHQPSSEDVMAVSQDGSTNRQKFIYAFERLPLAEVKEFQFRYQPYEWAHFRDVKLSPAR